ncbi:two-component sensor histidine kinase [Zafaria cholistanensis]|uniref:histidine kinase n=1 Tax=Zafaria cholistanensis TaxID=1682741 RepID=A0A5A7NNU5_9MICC|nr:ATP-binding protein [Zafaria cholistanensis]GER21717.1 two-component sensor histidine kinase [Zafaria cholistanensis]
MQIPLLRALIGPVPFHELSTAQKVNLSQLPMTFAVPVVVALAFSINPEAALADPLFLAGAAGVLLISTATALVPWDDFPPRAYLVVPLLDLVAIFFICLGGYSIFFALPFLSGLPIFWLAWSGLMPRTTLVVSVLAPLCMFWGQALRAGGPVDSRILGRPLVIPFMMLILALVVIAMENSTTSQNRKLQEAYAASRRQEKLLNAVLNAANVGVVVFDAAGKVVLTNELQQRIHLSSLKPGCGPEREINLALYGADPQGRPAAHEMPEKLRPLSRARAGEEFSDELLWAGPPEGARQALSASARRLLDDRNQAAGGVLVFKQVTDLVEALHAKDDFLSNVSHELRTPLTSIIGYLELLEDEPDLPASARSSLKVVSRNAERLDRLVDDLLTAAADRLEVRAQPLDLGRVVASCVRSALPRAAAGRLVLNQDIAPGVQVMGDPIRLGQVMDNLISNAIKYTPEGGRIDVALRVDRDGDGTPSAVATVADTGIGMDEPERERLFDRFFRAQGVRRAAIAGVGLGLPITEELVKAHGGEVTVDSEPGVGSTFTVRLPLLPPAPTGIAGQPEKAGQAEKAGHADEAGQEE